MGSQTFHVRSQRPQLLAVVCVFCLWPLAPEPETKTVTSRPPFAPSPQTMNTSNSLSGLRIYGSQRWTSWRRIRCLVWPFLVALRFCPPQPGYHNPAEFPEIGMPTDFERKHKFATQACDGISPKDSDYQHLTEHLERERNEHAETFTSLALDRHFGEFANVAQFGRQCPRTGCWLRKIFRTQN